MDERNDKPRDGALFVGGGPRQAQAAAEFAGDGKAEESADILEEMLNLLELQVAVEIREDSTETIVLDITGEDAGRAIGKKGQTLDALQFLANKIVNRFPDSRRHVVVDSGDYRERHDQGLIGLATRQAAKAISEGKVVLLQPMNARDRRVIHMALAEMPGVSTVSQGQGVGRRVQVVPDNAAKNPRR